MRDLGYVSGRNLLIEYRWGAGRNDRLAKLATELVDLRPDLIIASPTPSVLAAKDATKSIPIVFPISVDAVEAGVVDSLARPRGNVTGLTLMSADLIGKRLDLLRVMLPKASRLAFLSISGIPKITDPLVRELETKGRAVGISVRLYEVPSFGDAEAVIAHWRRSGGMVRMRSTSSNHQVWPPVLRMSWALPSSTRSLCWRA
jgi:putative ABC transport system substrate-binding protein